MKPSDDFELKEITKDKNAQTIDEISKEVGLSYTTVMRHARKMVDAGKWKQVWKRVNKRTLIAYVRVK